MDPRFGKHIERMPLYMEALVGSDFIERGDVSTVPKQGIYVFYENGKPIYVGRSNSMRQRLRDHCAQSSDHFSATFAYLLANEAAAACQLELPKTRAERAQPPQFGLL